MVLHYAHLAALAGGVDAFLIGSELRGLTTLRSATSAYPFVAGLKALAADVRGDRRRGDDDLLRGGLERVFRAPAGGRHRRRASSISIRSGRTRRSISSASTTTTRWPTGATSRAIRRGERALALRPRLSQRRTSAAARGSTGIYASAADRAAQVRTPITDGAYGKPWVFRFKDIEALVGERALRPAGRRRGGAPTDWVPRAQADLVHRARLPGGRQGRQPAERVLRSEIGAVGAAVFLQRRARRLAAARLHRRLSALLRCRIIRSSTGRTRSRRSMAGGWSTRRICISGPGTRGPIRISRT